MITDIETFQALMCAIYRNSAGEDNASYMLEDLYETSREISFIRPIGWLVGFMNYFTAYIPQNPYPTFTLACEHYEQGYMTAHNSYYVHRSHGVIYYT